MKSTQSFEIYWLLCYKKQNRRTNHLLHKPFIILPIMCGMIKSLTPKTICDAPKGFNCKRKWKFINSWSNTWIGLSKWQKLQQINFLLIGNIEGKTWVLFTLSYDILATLMVNKDQIGMHLMSIARKWGWDSKGTKHVKDKQVIIETCDFILCKWVATPPSSHIYKYHTKLYLQTMKENSCASIVGQLWKP